MNGPVPEDRFSNDVEGARGYEAWRVKMSGEDLFDEPDVDYDDYDYDEDEDYDEDPYAYEDLGDNGDGTYGPP